MAIELRILRIKEVATKLAIGKSTIYDWINPKSPRYDPSFPKPIKLGGNSIGWFSTMIDEWLTNKYLEQHPESLDDVLQQSA
ncbi:AlpA family phage regulatory protein [Vitreoscilla massiliensis]|uniref:AlpA family phage regulatory protein n=1 Tax=Vitreoscilla massiliensis TaxID=1689272 RepID=A0ABY4E311_9NEIS|nr:AlpA family phage regulatory protein [Vitreoscilla massiliensis]UOO89780.1 AlpA family phage regulatory protein [Vitreoscilla massiliensis]